MQTAANHSVLESSDPSTAELPQATEVSSLVGAKAILSRRVPMHLTAAAPSALPAASGVVPRLFTASAPAHRWPNPPSSQPPGLSTRSRRAITARRQSQTPTDPSSAPGTSVTATLPDPTAAPASQPSPAAAPTMVPVAEQLTRSVRRPGRGGPARRTNQFSSASRSAAARLGADSSDGDGAHGLGAHRGRCRKGRGNCWKVRRTISARGWRRPACRWAVSMSRATAAARAAADSRRRRKPRSRRPPSFRRRELQPSFPQPFRAPRMASTFWPEKECCDPKGEDIMAVSPVSNSSGTSCVRAARLRRGCSINSSLCNC